MPVIKAQTNTAGAATLDILVEQGGTFALDLVLTKDSTPWDVTAVTFLAVLATAWEPGSQSEIELTVTKTTPASGEVQVSLTAAQTSGITLPTTAPTSQGPAGAPRRIKLGGWILSATDANGTVPLCRGDVYFDRDPRE